VRSTLGLVTADETEERLNLRIVALVTLAGLAAVVFGLYLADFNRDSWSSLSVDIGTSIALVAVLFILERRLIARTKTTAVTAARSAAREVTEAFEERLVRLEELDEAQLRSRAERRRRDDSTIEAVRTEGLDARKVVELLRGAADSNLLAVEHGIRVRTSDDRDCPILHLLVADFGHGESLIVLDFEPIRFSGYHHEGMPVPERTATSVLWDDESAGEIAGQLEASLERLNIPPDKFRFKYALDRLVHSIDIMRAARTAGSDSALRLEGRLTLLINDEWILTDWGLESVSSSTRYKREVVWGLHEDLDPVIYGLRGHHGRDGFLIPLDARTSSPELGDAIAWCVEREGLVIGDPDDPEGEPVRRAPRPGR
jgi:hypothetical protein